MFITFKSGVFSWDLEKQCNRYTMKCNKIIVNKYIKIIKHNTSNSVCSGKNVILLL